tara:strand:- start:61103 stop:61327 length:225 start_codon:yes stop_codon:yes gene_type:complete
MTTGLEIYEKGIDSLTEAMNIGRKAVDSCTDIVARRNLSIHVDKLQEQIKSIEHRKDLFIQWMIEANKHQRTNK